MLSTESAEVLSKLIETLLNANAWPVVKEMISDEFDGQEDDLEAAIKELAEVVGGDEILHMAEMD